MSDRNRTTEKNDLIHDINSSIASLKSALDIIEQAWCDDYQLVDKIIPLASDKLNNLQVLISKHAAMSSHS